MICFLLLTTFAVTVPAAADDAEARVKKAIDSIRDLKVDGLSEDEKKGVTSRVNKALKVLRRNKKVAVPTARKVLSEEPQDSMLMLELSGFLMKMEPTDETLREITEYLVQADPSVNSASFFDIAFFMASKSCMPCLPAVLKILEVDRMDDIRFKALTREIGVVHGMVFTIGQYGDDAIDEVSSHLASANCVVRRNAIIALTDLLPLDEPATLQAIALEDPCPEARTAAWHGLAVFANPYREELTLTRLSSEPVPTSDEKFALSFVLSSVHSEASRKALEVLVHDEDPNIAFVARRALGLDLALPSDVPVETRWRGKVIGQLETALRTDHLYAKPDEGQYLASLTKDDLPLVNRARAAVLSRLSDECLYDEWYPLRGVARRLRARGSDSDNTAK